MPSWTQTPKEITFVLPLPSGAKGKDVKFKCTSKKLDMTVLGQQLLGVGACGGRGWRSGALGDWGTKCFEKRRA